MLFVWFSKFQNFNELNEVTTSACLQSLNDACESYCYCRLSEGAKWSGQQMEHSSKRSSRFGNESRDGRTALSFSEQGTPDRTLE